MTIQKINELFQTEALPYLQSKIDTKIHQLKKDLNFLDLTDKNKLSDRTSNEYLLEIGKYIGISFDDNGVVNVFIYFLSNDFEFLFKDEIFRKMIPTISEDEINQLRNMESDEDVINTYDNIFKKHQDEILAVVHSAILSLIDDFFENEKIDAIVEKVALQRIKIKLKKFLLNYLN